VASGSASAPWTARASLPRAATPGRLHHRPTVARGLGSTVCSVRNIATPRIDTFERPCAHLFHCRTTNRPQHELRSAVEARAGKSRRLNLLHHHQRPVSAPSAPRRGRTREDDEPDTLRTPSITPNTPEARSPSVKLLPSGALRRTSSIRVIAAPATMTVMRSAQTRFTTRPPPRAHPADQRTGLVEAGVPPLPLPSVPLLPPSHAQTRG
jgi:hypothetical protein